MTAPLKADVTAAERLLKAAVRRAILSLRDPATPPPNGADSVVPLLTNATHAADLLLTATDERPAKKAAKRAPRKAGA
jgi:hypothetical protein